MVGWGVCWSSGLEGLSCRLNMPIQRNKSQRGVSTVGLVGKKCILFPWGQQRFDKMCLALQARKVEQTPSIVVLDVHAVLADATA